MFKVPRETRRSFRWPVCLKRDTMELLPGSLIPTEPVKERARGSEWAGLGAVVDYLMVHGFVEIRKSTEKA